MSKSHAILLENCIMDYINTSSVQSLSLSMVGYLIVGINGKLRYLNFINAFANHSRITLAKLFLMVYCTAKKFAMN